MRYLLFLFVTFHVSAFSQQQQQQLANVVLINNINPVIQITQTNLVSVNDDNNVDNQIIQQQVNFNENKRSTITDEGLGNVRQKTKGNSLDLSLSFKLATRTSANSSKSSSGSQKHTLSKKLKKFERHFYGKLASHKKSKHLVDVCFNWCKS